MKDFSIYNKGRYSLRYQNGNFSVYPDEVVDNKQKGDEEENELAIAVFYEVHRGRHRWVAEFNTIPEAKDYIDFRLHKDSMADSSPDVPDDLGFAKLQGFTVTLRAMRHLTTEKDVLAKDEAEARAIAMRMTRSPDFKWDETEPEDINIEGADPIRKMQAWSVGVKIDQVRTNCVVVEAYTEEEAGKKVKDMVDNGDVVDWDVEDNGSPLITYVDPIGGGQS